MADEQERKKAIEESLELAEVLIGKVQISDQEFLERMARGDALVDDAEAATGLGYKIRLEAEVAREMLAAGEWEDVRRKWCDEAWRRWRESTFFKQGQERLAAGKTPNEDFKNPDGAP